MKLLQLRCLFFTPYIALVLCAIPIQVHPAVTDPDTGRTVEIVGVDDPDLKFELESKLLQSLKNDDSDSRTELLQAYPMEVDHEQTTDEKIVFRMLAPTGFVRPPEMPLERALRSIQENDIDLLKKAVESISDIRQLSRDKSYQRLITDAVGHNNLPIIKYLHEHCADCKLSRSGWSIFNDFDFTTTPYSRMNAETFRYVYEQGGVQSFLDHKPRKSIVRLIASYWIPTDTVYSDYSVTENDLQQELFRRGQRLEMLAYLLEQGFDINETSGSWNQTALHDAVQGNDKAVVEFILNNGADPKQGFNPLLDISSYTNIELVKALIEYGYDPTDTHLAGSPALKGTGANVYTGIAKKSRRYNAELLQLLSEYEIDVNSIDADGKTALDYSADEYGKEDSRFSDFLLSKGAIKTDRYFYSILMSAIFNFDDFDIERVKEVLNAKPHLASGTPSKLSNEPEPLEAALRMGNDALFILLVDSGAKIDREGNGADLLVSSISPETQGATSLLLSKNVNVNRKIEVDGKTVLYSRALFLASENGMVSFVKELLSRDASLEGEDLFDYPLYGAAVKGQVEVTKLLLEAGADANIRNEKDSLLSLVRKYEQNEVAALLVSYGAKE